MRLLLPVVVLAAMLLLLAFAVGVAVRGSVRRFDPRRYKPRADDRSRALVVEPSTAEQFAAAIGRLVTVEIEVVRALPAAPAAVPTLLGRTAGGIGLRLAFVGPAVRGRRGRAHVLGLLGSRVRARGLLLADEAHGLKLLATDPSMVVELA